MNIIIYLLPLDPCFASGGAYFDNAGNTEPYNLKYCKF